MNRQILKKKRLKRVTSSPRRVQLRRIKGWKLPPNTVCVTRPGRWGNPFKVGLWFKPALGAPPPHSHFCQAWDQRSQPHKGYTRIEDNFMAVEWFEKFLTEEPGAFRELRGKNLACWCRPEDCCHAQILLRLANA